MITVCHKAHSIDPIQADPSRNILIWVWSFVRDIRIVFDLAGTPISGHIPIKFFSRKKKTSLGMTRRRRLMKEG